MKKDKEWALKELQSKIIKNEVRFHTDGFNTGIHLALSIVAQIENPKTETLKPLVVPKGLGEWLSKQYLGEEESFFSIIRKLEYIWVKSEFEEFITDNKKELIEVILGTREYEVEKEQLYVLKLPYVNCFYTKVEEENRIGIGTPKSIKEMSSYHFTEKEILTKIPDVPKTLWIKLEDVQ